MANIGIYFWQEQRILEKEDYLSEIKKLQKRKKCRKSFPTRKYCGEKSRLFFVKKLVILPIF